MAGYGEAKPAPDTLQMLLGKYLGEGAEAVGSIFPPSNPYGQAVKNFLLGDIPETASRLEEGEPYVLIDPRAGRQLIKPEALEVAGFLPIAEVAKGAGLAAKGAAPVLGAIGTISKQEKAAEGLAKWAEGAPIVTSDVAESFGFKSGEPVLLEAFHGTKRPDRIGDVFKKSRATSGPMAFHTSSPDLASNYAQNKRDTSLYYEDTDYKDWFKTKISGSRNPVDIVRSWWHLSPEERKTISELAPRVTNDDEGNIILGPEDLKEGLGAFDMHLKESRGNPLGALVEEWLNSGSIYGREHEFMDVLKNAGYPINKVIYDSPEVEYPFVYKNYIKMNRPLVTNDIPQDVVDALNDAAKKDRSRVQYQTGSDPWDKKTRTLREWVEEFNKPDNKYVWTSIPDKVTEVFKKLGYDGIIDWSGKGGGTMSPVYVPFEETQVKSALGNVGKYDPTKKSILKAKGGAVQIPDHTRIQSIINDTLHMADGGEVDEPSFTDEARQKAAEALEGLKRMYEEATGKGWSENTLEGLKGTARAYTTDVLGMPVDLLTSLPVAPRESGNPYANAIRNLTESLGETPVGGSDWLAQKLGLYGEGLAHEAGRMFGPGAVKVFAPEKTVAKIFAGERAATADLEAKKLAEKMLEEGATFEDIWAKTGWGLGPGGQWRFEIPDWEAEYHPGRAFAARRENAEQNLRNWRDAFTLRKYMDETNSSLKNAEDWFGLMTGRGPSKDALLNAEAYDAKYLKNQTTIKESQIPQRENWTGYTDEVLSHPEFFNAYNLGGLPFAMRPKEGGILGSFSPEGIMMNTETGYGMESGKSTLLHELQHAVQEVENAPRGGFEGLFAQGPMRPKAQNILEDVGQTALGFRPYGVREVTESLGHAIPEGMEEILKKYGFKDPEDLKRYLEYEDLRRTPFGQYQRLAGEAEARLTQARAGMSPGERRVTYPWSPDYFREQTGIPLEDLIYRYENEGPSELITYHGTPHRFPATERNPLGEFDASKIGTGEGAQAYGHGIYLAESPGVARDYRKKLSDALSYKPEYWDGIPLPGLSVDEYKELDQLRQKLYKNSDQNGPAFNKEESEKWRVLKDKEDARNAAIEAARPKGSLYTVDLPDEMIDRMLDWDKPLSELPEGAQNALSKDSYFNRLMGRGGLDSYFQNGAELYRSLTGRFVNDMPMHLPLEQAENMAQKHASEYLRSLGIPGIRYLDQASRKIGEGTRNFVIFPGEEKNLNILERKARGGVVNYDPDKIQRIMASVLE